MILQLLSIITALAGTILTNRFSPKNKHIIDGGGAQFPKKNTDKIKNNMLKIGMYLLCASILIQLFILMKQESFFH